jgi:hypothetical protein
MLQRCACNAYDVKANNATYVRNFKPMCHEETCRRIHNERQRNPAYLLENPRHYDHDDPGDESCSFP